MQKIAKTCDKSFYLVIEKVSKNLTTRQIATKCYITRLTQIRFFLIFFNRNDITILIPYAFRIDTFYLKKDMLQRVIELIQRYEMAEKKV